MSTNELIIQFDGQAGTLAEATRMAMEKYIDWANKNPVQIYGTQAIAASYPVAPGEIAVGVTMLVRYIELHAIGTGHDAAVVSQRARLYSRKMMPYN